MGIADYLQETRGELRHVAWPTRMQTIVYTIMVVALSVFIALYLGFFDFLFTTMLSRSLELLPGHHAVVASTTTPAATTTTATPSHPATPSAPSSVPSFK